ncbi:MAG: SGNH/GDSL hydrolase family protein [Chitinophagaceae bacterium]|nr:SGNH/GDSL hydrolase family protein [Chitinophagaceae bacterium]
MKLKRITSLVLVLSALFAVLQSWQQKKPHVFLVGDSISIHYGPYLKKYTAEFAQLQQKELETIQGKEFPRNGGDSRRVLNYLTYKLNEPGFKPDYLLLNCGLHDIGRDTITRELQVPLAEYEVNLEKIFKLVSDKKK